MAAYGYPVVSDFDPYVMLVEKTAALTVAPGAPGGTLVDFLPACRNLHIITIFNFKNTDRTSVRYIPSWFPGAGFKRHALETRKHIDDILNVPYDFVKQRRVCNY